MKILNIACLFLVLFCITCHAEDSDLNKKIADCNQLVKTGNTEKALDLSAQLVKKNSKSRELFLCRSRAQMALDKFSDAITTLTTVDQLSSSPAEHMMSLAMLGNAYKSNKQLNEAILSYQQSMAIASAEKNKSFERIMHSLIGEARTLNNQADEAINSYQAALKLALNDNERADAFEHMAAIFNAQHKHNQAIEYQLKATLAYTHYGDLDAQANAGLELGRIYMDAGDHEQAERSINKILKMAVDNGGLYWEAKSNLYLAQLDFVKHQNADKHIEAAQRINKELNDASLAEDIAKVQALYK